MLELSDEQVLHFRARRGHLAGPGADDAAAAARAMLGAQAQQLPPALIALSVRTRERPTVDEIRSQVLDTPARLVRTWGQRDTLHLFDADDWPLVVAARAHWTSGGRGGPMPTDAMLDTALEAIEAAEGPVTRSDLIGVAPRRYERAIEPRATQAGLDARRLAASRLIWRLAHRGDLCVIDKIGGEQAYELRTRRLPDLAWFEASDRPEAAAILTRRYLAAYGPATAKDVAHFFGARVTEARQWLATLEDGTMPVACGDRSGLVALSEDADELARRPPRALRDWPLRLLPMWDSLLMGHADKSWTVPDADERPLVWGKAAMVRPVVVYRGRIVATWNHAVRGGVLRVELTPMAGWSDRRAAAVRRETRSIAAALGLGKAELA